MIYGKHLPVTISYCISSSLAPLLIYTLSKERNIITNHTMRVLDFIRLDEGQTKKTVSALQQLLSDFQIYYTNLRGFHWNIRGNGFFTLHAKFEELYTDAAEKVDTIAERILQLGGIPANNFSDYLKVAHIKEISGVSAADSAVASILDTLKHLIGEERKIVEMASDAHDETTVSIMDDFLSDQEKLAWMLTAYLS